MIWIIWTDQPLPPRIIEDYAFLCCKEDGLLVFLLIILIIWMNWPVAKTTVGTFFVLQMIQMSWKLNKRTVWLDNFCKWSYRILSWNIFTGNLHPIYVIILIRKAINLTVHLKYLGEKIRASRGVTFLLTQWDWYVNSILHSVFYAWRPRKHQ